MKNSKPVIKYYNTQLLNHLKENYVCVKIGARGSARAYALRKDEIKDAKIKENGSNWKSLG